MHGPVFDHLQYGSPKNASIYVAMVMLVFNDNHYGKNFCYKFCQVCGASRSN